MRHSAPVAAAVFSLCVVGACAASLLAQAAAPAGVSDLNGFWVFRVPTGDGNVGESFLDLKQQGRSGSPAGSCAAAISGRMLTSPCPATLMPHPSGRTASYC